MRIAYDHQAFCRRPYTGISRYFTALADALDAEASVEARVFAPLHVNAFLDASLKHLVHGRRVLRPPALVRPVLRGLNGVLARPAMRRFRPDVVHETYYQSRSMAPARTPTVLTVFDLIHERFPEEFPVYDRLLPAKRRAIARAARILCISERTRADLLRYYPIPPERASVVHLGVSPPRPPESAAEARLAAAAGNEPFLLYIGQRGGYKNFDALLRAYAGSAVLPGAVRLLCVGGDAPSGAERDQLAALGVADRVRHVVGSDVVLAAAYRGAVALVYPSRYEGFGLPLLEAMAHGCPVAASRGGALPEVLGDAGLSFDPEDIEAQRRVIETLVASGETRHRLRALGLERARGFSWQRCARETLEIYRSLLSEAAPVRAAAPSVARAGSG